MSNREKYGHDLRVIISENILDFRQENKISQENFAAMCNLHRTYIGSVERKERNLTLSTLEIIANTMKISVPKLLTKKKVNNEL